MVKQIHYILLAISLVFASCNSKESNEESIVKKPAFKGMKEGGVIYNLDYKADESNSILVSFMPKEIEVKFKDNLVVIYSEMALGQIKGTIIIDSKAKKVRTGINYGSKHYKTELAGKDVKFTMFDLKDYTQKETNKTCTVSNMECKVNTLVSPRDSFEIHYTNDIDIPNLHWTGEMAKINGFPLEYRMILNGINANATVKEVYATEFPESTFQLGDNYTVATKEQVNSIFKLFE